MTTTPTFLNSARRHLEVFEESWKANHFAAMECRHFEAFLAEAVMVFGLLHETSRQRREYVFRGLEEPNSGDDDFEKHLYERWVHVAACQVEKLQSLERVFGVVEGAERFRDCLHKAQMFLANWVPATVAKAPGSRMHEVTEEDADELRSLLEQQGEGGRPKWEPRSIPVSDPSVLP
jgi:hypothetical protein